MSVKAALVRSVAIARQLLDDERSVGAIGETPVNPGRSRPFGLQEPGIDDDLDSAIDGQRDPALLIR